MNFFKNGNGSVPETYTEWAKGRYSLYMKLFYEQELDYPYNKELYEKIKKEF